MADGPAASDKLCRTCGDEPRAKNSSYCSPCKWKVYRDKDPDRARRLQRERSDRYRSRNTSAKKLDHDKRRHGQDIEFQTARLLDTQGGVCFLCEGPLGASPHIDHDHRCCPPGYSCESCRRGIACARCNKAIGMLEDSPDLLELLARNLRAANARLNLAGE